MTNKNEGGLYNMFKKQELQLLLMILLVKTEK